ERTISGDDSSTINEKTRPPTESGSEVDIAESAFARPSTSGGERSVDVRAGRDEFGETTPLLGEGTRQRDLSETSSLNSDGASIRQPPVQATDFTNLPATQNRSGQNATAGAEGPVPVTSVESVRRAVGDDASFVSRDSDGEPIEPLGGRDEASFETDPNAPLLAGNDGPSVAGARERTGDETVFGATVTPDGSQGRSAGETIRTAAETGRAATGSGQGVSGTARVPESGAASRPADSTRTGTTNAQTRTTGGDAVPTTSGTRAAEVRTADRPATESGDAVPGTARAATTADRPATAADGPATVADRPATAADGPVTVADRPATGSDGVPTGPERSSGNPADAPGDVAQPPAVPTNREALPADALGRPAGGDRRQMMVETVTEAYRARLASEEAYTFASSQARDGFRDVVSQVRDERAEALPAGEREAYREQADAARENLWKEIDSELKADYFANLDSYRSDGGGARWDATVESAFSRVRERLDQAVGDETLIASLRERFDTPFRRPATSSGAETPDGAPVRSPEREEAWRTIESGVRDALREAHAQGPEVTGRDRVDPEQVGEKLLGEAYDKLAADAPDGYRERANQVFDQTLESLRASGSQVPEILERSPALVESLRKEFGSVPEAPTLEKARIEAENELGAPRSGVKPADHRRKLADLEEATFQKAVAEYEQHFRRSDEERSAVLADELAVHAVAADRVNQAHQDFLRRTGEGQDQALPQDALNMVEKLVAAEIREVRDVIWNQGVENRQGPGTFHDDVFHFLGAGRSQTVTHVAGSRIDRFEQQMRSLDEQALTWVADQHLLRTTIRRAAHDWNELIGGRDPVGRDYVASDDVLGDLFDGYRRDIAFVDHYLLTDGKQSLKDILADDRKVVSRSAGPDDAPAPVASGFAGMLLLDRYLGTQQIDGPDNIAVPVERSGAQATRERLAAVMNALQEARSGATTPTTPASRSGSPRPAPEPAPAGRAGEQQFAQRPDQVTASTASEAAPYRTSQVQERAQNVAIGEPGHAGRAASGAAAAVRTPVTVSAAVQLAFLDSQQEQMQADRDFLRAQWQAQGASQRSIEGALRDVNAVAQQHVRHAQAEAYPDKWLEFAQQERLNGAAYISLPQTTPETAAPGLASRYERLITQDAQAYLDTHRSIEAFEQRLSDHFDELLDNAGVAGFTQYQQMHTRTAARRVVSLVDSTVRDLLRQAADGAVGAAQQQERFQALLTAGYGQLAAQVASEVAVAAQVQPLEDVLALYQGGAISYFRAVLASQQAPLPGVWLSPAADGIVLTAKPSQVDQMSAPDAVTLSGGQAPRNVYVAAPGQGTELGAGQVADAIRSLPGDLLPSEGDIHLPVGLSWGMGDLLRELGPDVLADRVEVIEQTAGMAQESRSQAMDLVEHTLGAVPEPVTVAHEQDAPSHEISALDALETGETAFVYQRYRLESAPQETVSRFTVHLDSAGASDADAADLARQVQERAQELAGGAFAHGDRIEIQVRPLDENTARSTSVRVAPPEDADREQIVDAAAQDILRRTGFAPQPDDVVELALPQDGDLTGRTSGASARDLAPAASPETDAEALTGMISGAQTPSPEDPVGAFAPEAFRAELDRTADGVMMRRLFGENPERDGGTAWDETAVRDWVIEQAQRASAFVDTHDTAQVRQAQEIADLEIARSANMYARNVGGDQPEDDRLLPAVRSVVTAMVLSVAHRGGPMEAGELPVSRTMLKPVTRTTFDLVQEIGLRLPPQESLIGGMPGWFRRSRPADGSHSSRRRRTAESSSAAAVTTSNLWIGGERIDPLTPGLDEAFVALAEDGLYRNFADWDQAADFVQGLTDNMGNLPVRHRERTWFSFAPHGAILVADNHFRMDLVDLIGAVTRDPGVDTMNPDDRQLTPGIDRPSFISEAFVTDDLTDLPRLREVVVWGNARRARQLTLDPEDDLRGVGAESVYAAMGFALTSPLSTLDDANFTELTRVAWGRVARGHLIRAWAYARDIAEHPDQAFPVTEAEVEARQARDDLIEFWYSPDQAPTLVVFFETLVQSNAPAGQVLAAMRTKLGAREFSRSFLRGLRDFIQKVVAVLRFQADRDPYLDDEQKEFLHGETDDFRMFHTWRNLHMGEVAVDAANWRGVRLISLGRNHVNYLRENFAHRFNDMSVFDASEMGSWNLPVDENSATARYPHDFVQDAPEADQAPVVTEGGLTAAGTSAFEALMLGTAEAVTHETPVAAESVTGPTTQPDRPSAEEPAEAFHPDAVGDELRQIATGAVMRQLFADGRATGDRPRTLSDDDVAREWLGELAARAERFVAGHDDAQIDLAREIAGRETVRAAGSFQTDASSRNEATDEQVRWLEPRIRSVVTAMVLSVAYADGAPLPAEELPLTRSALESVTRETFALVDEFGWRGGLLGGSPRGRDRNRQAGAASEGAAFDPWASTREGLLAGLKALTVDDPVIDPVEGPDLFGPVSAPTPSFMGHWTSADYATGQIVSLFHFMDLTRKRAPRVEEVDPENLATLEVEELGPNGEYELPRMRAFIWFGSAFTDATPSLRTAREEMARVADELKDQQIRLVLFTDIPRTDFEDARAGHGRPDVQDMSSWARKHSIKIVNLWEVFHDGNPMRLQERVARALAARQGRGYVMASDIVRHELGWAFGVDYRDHDTAVGDWHRGVESARATGHAVHLSRNGGWTNAAFVVGRRNPFSDAYLNEIAKRYERTEPDLFTRPVWNRTDRENSRMLLSRTKFAVRRYSVLNRTGTDFMSQVAEWMGLEGSDQFTPLDDSNSHGALSWESGTAEEQLSGTEFRDPPLYVVRDMARRLARSLWNRDGDLRSTETAAPISKLPDPDAAWLALFDYILSRPELASRIRTLTDRAMVPETEPMRVEVVPLPDDIYVRLGIEPAREREPEGSWRLGELMRPVRLPGQTTSVDDLVAQQLDPYSSTGQAGLHGTLPLSGLWVGGQWIGPGHALLQDPAGGGVATEPVVNVWVDGKKLTPEHAAWGVAQAEGWLSDGLERRFESVRELHAY
ncbi:hypothetical protein KIH74_35530, partial [Kineosporia sp. J2-2]